MYQKIKFKLFNIIPFNLNLKTKSRKTKRVPSLVDRPQGAWQIGGSSGATAGAGGVPTWWRQLEVAPITFRCWLLFFFFFSRTACLLRFVWFGQMNCAVSISNYDMMEVDLRPHAGRTIAIEMSFVKINLTAFQAAAATPSAAKGKPHPGPDRIQSL